jgi:hypothetical protein
MILAEHVPSSEKLQFACYFTPWHQNNHCISINLAGVIVFSVIEVFEDSP